MYVDTHAHIHVPLTHAHTSSGLSRLTADEDGSSTGAAVISAVAAVDCGGGGGGGGVTVGGGGRGATAYMHAWMHAYTRACMSWMDANARCASMRVMLHTAQRHAVGIDGRGIGVVVDWSRAAECNRTVLHGRWQKGWWRRSAGLALQVMADSLELVLPLPIHKTNPPMQNRRNLDSRGMCACALGVPLLPAWPGPSQRSQQRCQNMRQRDRGNKKM